MKNSFFEQGVLRQRELLIKSIELDENLIFAKTLLGWTYYETDDLEKAMKLKSQMEDEITDEIPDMQEVEIQVKEFRKRNKGLITNDRNKGSS